MASSRWALLDRRPSYHDGAITVDVRSAPATSLVRLPYHRIDSRAPQGLPYVIAADKTGGLLISFTKLGDGQQAHPDLAILTLDKGAITPTLPPRKPQVHPIAPTTDGIGFMPLPTRSSSSRLEFTVAELQTVSDPESETGRARLICFDTYQGGEWVEKESHIPAFHACRPWGRDGVLSHAGMLWWVDLSWGLACCDPLAPAPIFNFVELPVGGALDFADIVGRRSLSISGSRIRYIAISRARVRDRPSRVNVWTLRGTAAADGGVRTDWKWEETGGATFADICAGESYGRTRLPARLPTLAVLSPIDPDFACFHLEGYLFGVHLASKRVDWVSHHVPTDRITWELPSALRGSATRPASEAMGMGGLNVRGFKCTFIRGASSSTCMIIKRLQPAAEFSIRLWHAKYPIRQLDIVEQFGGSGSLLYSCDADTVATPLIVPRIRQFLLFAPIPDLHCIFSIFGIAADSRVERNDAVEGFKPNGSTRIAGSLEDESSTVLFREHYGTPNPILMLECTLGDMECFGMQLCFPYLSFHNLSITTSRHGQGTSTVSLQVKEDSRVQKIKTHRVVCSYIPLPYLAKIATLF